MSRDRPALRPFELDPSHPATTVIEEPPPRVVASALAEEEKAEEMALAPPEARRGLTGRLLGLFTLGVVGAGVVQAVDYVGNLLSTEPWLGAPLAVFLAAVLVGGVGLAANEAADMRRLSKRAAIRQQAERLAGSELTGEAPALLAKLEAQFGDRPALNANLAAYRAQQHDAMNDGELLRLFERKVLAPVDQAAYRLVLESSRDVGLLTALSPLGLLDGVLVLWRTTMLFRSIARLYGMAPGPLTTFRLLRNSVRNAAFAGLADVVTHAAVEHVGAGLLALMSARAGQGAGNALLHARLGIEAMRQCRPLPFMAEEPPRLANVRNALFGNDGKSNGRGKLA